MIVIWLAVWHVAATLAALLVLVGAWLGRVPWREGAWAGCVFVLGAGALPRRFGWDEGAVQALVLIWPLVAIWGASRLVIWARAHHVEARPGR